jgi:hypothetical protein
MFPPSIAAPQGCNIQTFYGAGITFTGEKTVMAWNKPVGVSHVYMMLIGGGSGGNGTSGGGSGAVTVWYGAAQHVPDSLVITPAPIESTDPSTVAFRNTTALRVLLSARSGNSTVAGATTAAGPFAAFGFYQSTAGQDGTSGVQTPSATTFLGGGSGGAITGNYGYTVADNRLGFFQMQPIIVGLGSSAGASSGSSGVGCGGAYATNGGPGMVLIASW